MSKYSTSLLPFKSILGKKVQADFDGGEITSDAGVLLLRETEDQVGIISRLVSAISDRRNQGYIEHPLKDLLSQRIYQIACGYPNGNDCNDLRNDPAFKIAVNRLPLTGDDLASQPTHSRLENDIRRPELLRIAYAFLDNFIASYPSPPPLIVLDFDDTEDETHGQQELSLFNGYYDSRCYLPLHVYEGLSGKLIASILRPGKRPTGQQAAAILKRIVKRIRSAWPHTLILFRGDAHFSAPETLKYCEDHGLLFCLGLAGNDILSSLAASLLAQAKSLFASSHRDIRLYDSFLYQAESWHKPFRVIAKVEITAKGASTRFIVTNLSDPDDSSLYEQIYSPRGQMENYIKDHKLFLQSGRTSCHKFTANQLRLFLHSAAYVLLHAFRQNILPYTQFATAQFDTIRLYLLKIGAKIKELKTKVKLHLPSSFPHKSILAQAGAIFSILAVP